MTSYKTDGILPKLSTEFHEYVKSTASITQSNSYGWLKINALFVSRTVVTAVAACSGFVLV